ncbi:MAG TPA: hypothetical protein DIW31_08160 [Bacteroidales bacterium]|nr:hypothetical protein [Bacteroidales bacterium]
MKRLLIICFLLLFVTASAQESSFQSRQGFSTNGLTPSFEEIVKKTDTIPKKGKVNPLFKGKKESISSDASFQQSDDIRNEWLKKGGKVYYVSIMLTGTYISMDIDKVGKMNGYGGGYSFFMNMINLKMPEYKTGPSNWKSFNWGLGYDLVIYNFKFPLDAGTLRIDMNSTYMNIMFTGNVGYTWGFGKYIDESTWKGVALTLKYKPSYNLSLVTSTITTKIPPMPPVYPNGYTQTTTDSQSSGSFNAGGFGFDLDFNKFSATAEKLAPRPRTKFSFFILPPIGDNPLFVSASLGVLFYPRQRGFAKR